MFSELISGIKSNAEVVADVPLKYTENSHFRDLIQDSSSDPPNYTTKIFDYEIGGMKPFYGIYSSCLENRIATRAICKSLKLKKYDIFHPTYYDPYFLDYLGDIPFVVTIHDMIPELFGWEHPVIEQKQLLVKHASKVIVVSENTKNDLLKIYGLPEESVSVVYHGSSLNTSSQHPKSHLKLPQRYILFTGKRSAYKNFTFFIESIAPLLLADKDLFVLCTKIDRSRNSFSQIERELFDSLNIREQVIEINTSDIELATMYEGALCYVCPSRYEGFGIPIVEAFHCDCPVVVSNTSSMPEIAGDAAIYFDPTSHESIHNAVAQVINDKSLRESLRGRGKIRKNKFSWEKSIEQTLGIYKSML